MAKTHKFAHMSDCHLGAFRDELLRNLGMKAFEKTIDICIEEKVDFIIISGDLFHIHIPDMSIADYAFRCIQRAKKNGIEIYLVYGSHDYSATEKSIIDLLVSAGLVTKVFVANYDENNALKLEFTTDEKTGAKITGISGRKGGLEKEYFRILNLEHLEKEKGFKIFVFHSALTEFKPDFLSKMDSVPLSYFPKNFNYYAAGHVHERFEKEEENYGLIVYPGPLFAAEYNDLEQLEKQKSGFAVVEFSENVITRYEFINIDIASVRVLKYNADGQVPSDVEKALLRISEGSDVSGKIVLFKIKGELNSGKVYDINFQKVQDVFLANGAALVKINKNALTTKEKPSIYVHGETKEDIEKKLIKECIGRLRIKNMKLQGENGINLSMELLKLLKIERGAKTVSEYNNKILAESSKLLDIGE